MYLQAKAKSSQPEVSEFSISLSVTFDTKCAGYLFFRHDSSKQIETLLDDLLTWSVKE